jgi:putative ABC transport system permease protein
MIQVALKGLVARRLRAALTALAIVLGVAMVSATYAFTDRIENAVDTLFTGAYTGADAVVSGKDVVESSTSGDAAVPAELLRKVAALPEVDAVSGGIVDTARLLDQSGEPISTQDQALGLSVDASAGARRFNPLKLTAGRWPSGATETAIDASTAETYGFAVGDNVTVATRGPARRFRISGIAEFTGLNSLGELTLAIFDVPTAQALLDKEGELDAVQMAAEDGVAPEELVASLRQELGDSVTVRSGAEQASEDSDDVAMFTTIIRYFLLTFAGIALFVGAFVIFNTLSITVAQRTREFATLRTVGASRRQVLGSVILEALVIGLLASTIGLFAGLGLAVGLNELFVALNLDLPQTETVFATRTIVVSLLVGTVITLIAGLSPALRATRVPPIAAVREGAKLPRSALARFAPYIAVATVVLAVLALSYAMLAPDVATGNRFILLGVGVLALFIGVALLSSRLVIPLTRLVGWPARRIGGAAGTLAEGNAMRDPGRTASTAAALMIGIALVTFVGVLAQGLRVSNSTAIEEQIQADFVVTSQDGYSEFPAAVGDAAAEIEGTDVVSSVRQDVAELDGAGGNLTGLDAGSITEVYDFRWTEGSDEVLASLGDDGAVVPDDVADDKDLVVGDSFAVLTADNERREFVVRGIYDGSPFYPLLGTASISREAFDALYDRPRNRFTLINVPGAPTEAQKATVESGLDGFPDTRVFTRQEWIDKEDTEISQFLLLLYVLLALSVIVSLFGMINTLALSVFERTRELGMLRAVGMTRRQVRRMVRHESVITALIGAALGLPLGIFLALLVTQALSEYDLQFAIPAGALITFVIVSVIAGIVAAILPARRAARLRVLEALQYE